MIFFLYSFCSQAFAEDDSANRTRSPGSLYDAERDELGICKQVFTFIINNIFAFTLLMFCLKKTNEFKNSHFLSAQKKSLKLKGLKKLRVKVRSLICTTTWFTLVAKRCAPPLPAPTVQQSFCHLLYLVRKA